jgi:hypothetical protein
MGWYLDSTRIFVQDWKLHEDQIIPRLQPLNGGTVKQIFGYESPITNINAIIVGSADADTLRAMTEDGATHTLVVPSGEYGADSYEVKNIALARIMCICQTIRPDLPTDAPVYTVDIELYGD